MFRIIYFFFMTDIVCSIFEQHSLIAVKGYLSIKFDRNVVII